MIFEIKNFDCSQPFFNSLRKENLQINTYELTIFFLVNFKTKRFLTPLKHLND
jgi:hypothetical protein